MKRPVYLVDSGKPSSDLLGGAAAGEHQNFQVVLLVRPVPAYRP